MFAIDKVIISVFVIYLFNWWQNNYNVCFCCMLTDGRLITMWVFCMSTVGKLMELHGDGGSTTTASKGGVSESGEKVDRPEGYEPPVLETV